MTRKRVIFLHVKKSAGTFFNSALSLQYVGRKSYWVTPKHSSKEFLKLAQHKRDQFRLIRGHIPFGCHDWFSDDSSYITILRNPQKRVFSCLNYWKQQATVHPSNNGWWFQLIREHSAETLLSEKLLPELENGMIRQLSGKGNRPEECTEYDLNMAMHNLEKNCIAFGLTERFSESLAVFDKVLRWRLPVIYSSANISNKTTVEYNDCLNDLIVESNVLDQRLYTFAQDIFEKRYQHLNLFEKEKSIQQANQFLAPFQTLAKGMKRRVQKS
jgi:hypothetical protein